MSTPEVVKAHGLSWAEYQQIIGLIGKDPNLVELGIFSVMWSEHCSYKSSKIHLGKLPTKAPWVVCGPGENAGVVDIGGGLVAIFKMESHNHPSYIEPFQGAATGVGGIMRDVFTMGARPIAILDSLRFGSPQHPKTRRLVDGVVRGIAGYGNCVGVPTVGGETTFHRAFDGNILVNAMCVGVAPADRVFYAAAAGIGNPVVYVGAKTGRDGIHGATMASAEFSGADSEEKRPTVQVGDPFREKLLIEACLELMEKDAIVAIQDMGAAGLTSSSFEMAAKGDAGIELDLDAVPMREPGMTPYEIMLSESQERMLMVLNEGREAEAEAIFRKWELDFAVIGRVTDTGRMVLKRHGEIVADLPVAPIAGNSPVYQRPYVEPEAPIPVPLSEPASPPLSHDQAILKLMGSPDLCSKRWIWQQYDHTVGADTLIGPGGDAAVVRVLGTDRALAISADCTPRYCQASPRVGGMQAVAECRRNIIATGAKPLAITNCLNFGNPERPEVMGQFVGCIEGMAKASEAFRFPVVSGNVSLYNETDGRAVQPTPDIGGIGLIENLDRVTGIAPTADGQVLILVGESYGWMGASLWLRDIMGREEGAPPPVDLDHEKRNGEFVLQEIGKGVIRACHDVSDGGLAIAVAEMCLASGRGATLQRGQGLAAVGWLFGEEQGRYVLAVDPADVSTLLATATRDGVIAREIGRVGGSALQVRDLPPISIEDLRRAHEGWLPAYMGEDAVAV
ncbi:MAG TPA: phosphoribosylformylglycinamidine synthase subunit PurL [Geminicoccus sp.]|jgi:phosphoribosylformylglycinamidine synthase|uniref:phosphoribosylformylglycinamidine synthase subunit PurL n=1 Tax=Geminicoccus sp. TaxID=2024832 RepID=UPI002E34BBCD|nr:phosphoribosylformylglycinamidine synthase subunit PurL [Geminicoccus sp.]HEX2526784.1 phosphoribosylformylglycinamidine synthase subunit PurL [Geminicoccus sp.]